MEHDGANNSENLAYLEALYQQMRRDPTALSPEWLEWLRSLEHETNVSHGRAHAQQFEQFALQVRVEKLIHHYRLHGHLGADIDPLARPRPPMPALDPTYFGLSDEHLDREVNPGNLFPAGPVTVRRILQRLQRSYCRHVGIEYWHLMDLEQRTWLQERIESNEGEFVPETEEQMRLLTNLAEVEVADKYMHAKFLGAKRFSIAGAESVIACLVCVLEQAGELGCQEVVIGMAHRGRVGVMMNVLGKTPVDMFSEFEQDDPWESLGSGDVKYHKGSFRHYTTTSGAQLYVALMFNPSHLEAITPVVAGRVRAKQDQLPDQERGRVLGITIHGDAAFPAQGVVTETLNLSRLDGYSSGGTIRIVINNQIGFTTNPEDARSSAYATDVAHGIKVPVFHVNGDDPEAAAWVARLAVGFRQRFESDVIIDLVCYRRFGHNEIDDPTFTQPTMYANISTHPSVRSLYQRTLIERNTMSTEQVARIDAETHERLDEALAAVRSSAPRSRRSPMHGVWQQYHGGPEATASDVDTSIDAALTSRLADAIVAVPDGFEIHPKLDRMRRDLHAMLAGAQPLSWSAAEHLAYGSLLLAGIDVRLSGQDTRRGTFGHRHAVWFDRLTGAPWTALEHLDARQGRFSVYDSPLSEYAVLGFEFGYTLMAPGALVIWEAQFGDFANAGQVIIDSFIAASEDKWNRLSGLVLLLPHGYEGQGPEHSSARLERFLQLCAEDNLQVCVPTTSAQLFHVLRRQVLRRWRKPLVVMSPKSLLRSRPSFSPIGQFVSGRFERVLDDANSDAQHIDTLLLCSGKIYYDLVEERSRRQDDRVAVIRVEQLYPFPEVDLAALIERYSHVSHMSWVQEEPENMGAWSFMAPRLHVLTGGRIEARYAGRPASASPATGSSHSHKLELELVLKDAFGDRSGGQEVPARRVIMNQE